MKDYDFNSIYELLDSEAFRKRTAMYLGEKSISKLKTFMDGFYTCERNYKINSQDTLPPFWLFFKWICTEYNHSGSYYSWDGIILQNSNNNEEVALNTFFEKFDEFRKFFPHTILRCEIGETEVKYFNSHEGIRKRYKDGVESRIEPANFLYIIKYSGNLGCSCHHHVKEKHINSDWFSTIEKANMDLPWTGQLLKVMK